MPYHLHYTRNLQDFPESRLASALVFSEALGPAWQCLVPPNRILPGSLVMRLPDSELGGVPTQLYGGVSGAVGLVASLPWNLFEMLLRLQEGLKKVCHPVMQLMG
jgi:hypothetical protein